MIADLAVYGGLFLLAFVAATVLPSQSEIALAALIAKGDNPVVLLVAAATLGNILGSVTNWWLGMQVERFRDRKWFPVKPAQLEKAQDWYAKYGRWSLLLAWVPIIGDPLTLAAGVMREKLAFFIPIVAAAKLARYVVVALVAAKVF